MMATTSSTIRRQRSQRISAAAGLAAVLAGSVVTLLQPPVNGQDAHAKFDVISVVARPSATAPATVTETDKPHGLVIPKATPEVRAPRTVISRP